MTKINLQMNQYKSTPVYVKAMKLEKDVKLPDVNWSEYFENTAYVLCDRARHKVAKAGDYLILGVHGWEDVMSEVDFRSKYTPTGVVL